MTDTATDMDREAAYGQIPSFSKLIAHFRRGTKDNELTGQLADVVRMVKDAYKEGVKKGGTLTIKINVDPLTDEQVAVSIESQAKGPKLPAEASILFVDELGMLATESAFATRMPLGGNLVGLPSGADAYELPDHDPDTGEIL